MITVGVEWPPLHGYCVMRSLYTPKQPPLFYVDAIFYFNIVPRTSLLLAFELGLDILVTRLLPNVVEFDERRMIPD